MKVGLLRQPPAVPLVESQLPDCMLAFQFLTVCARVCVCVCACACVHACVCVVSKADMCSNE